MRAGVAEKITMRADAADHLVSILMPAYNAGRWIGEAIESCIAQTHTNWELLIVDDGSADDTAAVAEGFARRDDRVYVQRAEHRGVSAALNAAFVMSKGALIAQLGADDRQHPRRLEFQLQILLHDPQGPEMTTCATQSMAEDGTLLNRPGFVAEKKVGFCFGAGGPLMFWRTINEHIGGWDEELRCAVDVDWMYRALLAGNRYSVTPLRLYYVRQHASKLTIRRREELFRNCRMLYKKYLGNGEGLLNNGTGRVIRTLEVARRRQRSHQTRRRKAEKNRRRESRKAHRRR